MTTPSMAQPAANGPVLRLKEITKRFGPVTANEDVSFYLFPGEVIALLGEPARARPR